MKQPKRLLVLSSSDYRLMLHGLIHFRNKLIRQGRYPDAIDELLIKLHKGKAILKTISLQCADGDCNGE